MEEGSRKTDWIRIKARSPIKGIPAEIRIGMDGAVYIDGEPYDRDKCNYPNLAVDVEKHNKMNTGEETRKIVDAGKTAKRGEQVTITDIQSPDTTESTTVKF